MKQFIKVFLNRGALFCGLGPVIMAIVYIFLSASGVDILRWTSGMPYIVHLSGISKM